MNGKWQRGSAVLEFVLLAPALLAFILLCIAGGRIWLARQTIDAAAFDAARTASIARSAQAATSGARSTAMDSLTSRQMHCVHSSVSVATAGFYVPVGQPATVQVTLTCQMNLSDIALPGLPSTMTMTSTAGSVLDQYRARTDR